ncbi:MAG: hypothetical protein MET45_03315 [Nostoc sp. LLA-1]|nr:hypothetical protein [Cyanocohniella sp. LLY]
MNQTQRLRVSDGKIKFILDDCPKGLPIKKIISHCVGRGAGEQGSRGKRKEKYHLNKLSNLFSGSPERFHIADEEVIQGTPLPPMSISSLHLYCCLQ